jgi:hypothetical protein
VTFGTPFAEHVAIIEGTTPCRQERILSSDTD